MVGVTGSIPVAPTTLFKNLRAVAVKTVSRETPQACLIRTVLAMGRRCRQAGTGIDNPLDRRITQFRQDKFKPDTTGQTSRLRGNMGRDSLWARNARIFARNA